MELKKKITLGSRGDSHSLPLLKKGESRDIVCNLNWSSTPKNAGFLSRVFGSGIDLDLGVYYELKNGKRSVIDGLQFAHGRGGTRHQNTRQGYYDGEPWVWHSGDDLTGASSAGEYIYVNPKGLKDIVKLQFYASIYESKVNWSDTDAVITIQVPGHPEIAINLGGLSSRQGMCLFCTINVSSVGIEVNNETSFHNSHSEIDKYYGWGMRWTAGSK